MGYIANYGYTDGSGTYLITIDSGKCNSCGKCVTACPQGVFEVAEDDYGDMVALVKDKLRNELKYLCSPCKPISRKEELPCIQACKPGAITHSW